jgi:hypothetical protein
MGRTFFEIDSEEAHWNSNKKYEGGNTGHRPAVKGGYFPVAPVDSLHDIRAEMCQGARSDGHRPSKCTTTKSRTRASARSASSSTPWCRRPTNC